jgi:bacterial leucyl aminopeptidase
VRVDNLPPIVEVQEPAPGTVSGVVDVIVKATDVVGVDHVDVFAGATFLGTATVDASDPTLHYASWATTAFDNRTFPIIAVAYDLALNSSESAPANVALSNPTTAVYSATLKAPTCAASAAWCWSGTLLDGPGSTEASAPNTLGGSCADGTAGVYHQQE